MLKWTPYIWIVSFIILMFYVLYNSPVFAEVRGPVYVVNNMACYLYDDVVELNPIINKAKEYIESIKGIVVRDETIGKRGYFWVEYPNGVQVKNEWEEGMWCRHIIPPVGSEGT